MAIDAVLVGKGVASASTATTAAGTTTSGSTLVIATHFDGVRNVSSVADSKGNTYTQAGTKQKSGAAGVALYYCENCTGGASHTATVTYSAASSQIAYLIEITGAETASFDQTAQGTDASTPWTLTSPTLSQADELVISIFCLDIGSTAAYSSSNTTIIGEEQNGSTYYSGAVSKLVVSSTSAVSPSFTRAGATTQNGALKLATFKAAATGGTDYPLTAAQGSFALTGQAATLTETSGYTLTADQGSFALTGSDAYRDISMTSAQGAFAMTGIAAGLVMARKLTAAQGSFALNGRAANLVWSGASGTLFQGARIRRRFGHRYG